MTLCDLFLAEVESKEMEVRVPSKMIASGLSSFLKPVVYVAITAFT